MKSHFVLRCLGNSSLLVVFLLLTSIRTLAQEPVVAKPYRLDPEKMLNAFEHGLVPDSDEDQSDQLNALMKKVGEDAQLDALYVPAGHYRIAKSIYLRPNVNLVGDGIGRTVFDRVVESNYLVRQGASGNFGDAIVANLSFRNQVRTLLLGDVHHLRFHHVEFEGGLVRFEKSSHITIEQCFFNRNLGKGGYASSNCSNMRIVRNRFLSIEKGSINLSGHTNSYVAYNHVVADTLIDSGYAGIRLPNSATGNIIEHNYIENHGRGLFLLTYSNNNTLRNNTIKSTKHQGILIQTSNNVVENNVIIDAGLASIHVSHAHYDEPQPSSIADNNRIYGNLVLDTKKLEAVGEFGVFVGSSENVVTGNVVEKQFGREFMSIRDDANNSHTGNVYR